MTAGMVRFHTVLLVLLCGALFAACPGEDPVLTMDADGDGHEWVGAGGDDCDDTNPATHPNADEICDGLDNNCDEQADEGVLRTFFPDRDGDGFGDRDEGDEACVRKVGLIEIGGDCDDADDEIHPDADEVCDLVDNNCDDAVDEDTAVDAVPWFDDADSDGFGDDGSIRPSCTRPAGVSDAGGDCDDGDPAVFPGAAESCDAVDNDCDGIPGQDDGDGDVDPNCSDCDDGDPAIFTGAVEVCDAVDQDCDGALDEDFDTDGDGVSTCGPDGSAGNGDDDCNDGDSWTYPAAPEIPYDSIDQDCDGADLIDVDEDGFDGVPAGGDDCNDDEAFANPGMPTDLLDGFDNDCDGQVDEGPVSYVHDLHIQPVWSADCMGCHSGATPSAGLDLSPAVAYETTVDVPSDDVPAMPLFTPGDPAASYMWHKLNNTQTTVNGAGVSMPRNAPLLPQETRDMIELWILEGCVESLDSL